MKLVAFLHGDFSKSRRYRNNTNVSKSRFIMAIFIRSIRSGTQSRTLAFISGLVSTVACIPESWNTSRWIPSRNLEIEKVNRYLVEI